MKATAAATIAAATASTRTMLPPTPAGVMHRHRLVGHFVVGVGSHERVQDLFEKTC